MPFAIEMNLDAEAEGVVRKIWAALKEEGFGSMGLKEARPHVTLGIAADVENELEKRLEAFASSLAPMSFHIRSVGTFPGGVVFLAPIVTRELLEMHAKFHELFGLRPSAISKLYVPGAWVPHCTLASELTQARMGEAVRVVLQSGGMPISGRFEEISLVEYAPVRQVGSWVMAG
jgi:2'-5' RNA ligase